MEVGANIFEALVFGHQRLRSAVSIDDQDEQAKNT